MSENTSKPIFKGSCHCGFVTYQVAIEPTNRKATRCNCTWCHKQVYTNLEVAKDDFKLLTPSSLEELSNYNPKQLGINRRFCKDCGTHIVREGYYEYDGQRFDFFKVNLMTVDQPQDGLDLKDFAITYIDGLSDTWAESDKPHRGGTA